MGQILGKIVLFFSSCYGKDIIYQSWVFWLSDEKMLYFIGQTKNVDRQNPVQADRLGEASTDHLLIVNICAQQFNSLIIWVSCQKNS